MSNNLFFLFFCFFLVFCLFFLLLLLLLLFLGPLPWHMEVPMLGVKSELQLPAYTTATATQDPSHICNLHHSNAGSELRLQPTPQLTATLDP